MTVKVAFTVSKRIVLFNEVFKVLFTLDHFDSSYSLLVALHLFECIGSFNNLFILFNFAHILSIMCESCIVLLLLSNKLLFDPVVSLLY